MAKPIKRKGKRGDTWEVQISINNTRKTVRFGAVTEVEATEYAALADAIADHRRRLGDAEFPLRVLRELNKLPRVIRTRFARAGMIEETPEWTLEKYLTTYSARRNVKPATKVNWSHTVRNLVEFFGPGKRLHAISRGDAERFRDHLMGMKIAPATIAKRLQNARQFFNSAVNDRALEANPFEGIAHHSAPDKQRQYFITQDDTLKLIEHAPSIDWRTMIALARFGGLRCPSEVLSLQWSGFDWDGKRFRVDSPKTEHHPNGGFRIVPMFFELRPFLDEARKQAGRGAKYVISNESYRKAAKGATGWKNCNLRSQLHKIIKRAGLKPWPKAWQNMRSSRETELLKTHPVQAVCEWVGNSPKVAMEHYAQITDEDWGRAASSPQSNSAAENAAAGACKILQLESESAKNSGDCDVLPPNAAPCKEVGMGDTGFEPVTSAV